MVTAITRGKDSEGENPRSGRGMKQGRESQREANPWGAEKAREGKVLSEANSGGPCSLVDVAERETKPMRGAM